MTTQAEAPTRTKLLDAAEELMLSRGYVAASIDGICKAAGVTKGSFFHYFSGKEELGGVLLRRFAERQGAAFQEALQGIDDPLERVLAMMEFVRRSATDPGYRGCLVGTLAQEISETHPELRDICKGCFEGFSASLAADLTAAKVARCPEAGFDPAGLASMFLALCQGSMLLRRTSGDAAGMVAGIDHFETYVRGLYGVQ